MSRINTWYFGCRDCGDFAIGDLDYVIRTESVHHAGFPDHRSSISRHRKHVSASQPEVTVKPISRERWRSKFHEITGWTATNGDADALAKRLGIEPEDPEPREVRLARLMCFLYSNRGTIGDYRLAADIAQSILNDYERCGAQCPPIA